ncbi:MAG: hypothetical protein JNM39_18765 [Bdellovibrionaceae bacterium]|nr:hypothetical protein [Pseudobdellovibrionaceae bacterium]
MKVVIGIIFILLSLSEGVHAAGIGGARAQFDSKALKFHRTKSGEQKKYEQYMPKLKGLEKPTAIEEVSEPFTVEMASPQKHGKSETLKGIILSYDIDLKVQTEDDEHIDVFQILLQNSQGQVVHNEIVRESRDFRVFNVDTPKGKDVVIRSLEYNPKNSRELMSRVRQLNAKVDRYESVGLIGPEDDDLSFSIVDAQNTVAVGKPKSGNGPWGLYRVTAKGPELIQEFSEEIPGFKGTWLDRFGADEHPRKMVQEILGAFATNQDSLVIINDLKGILAVSLTEGNKPKRLFTVPREGTFAAVLKTWDKPKTGQCQQFVLGIYRNDQGSYFYSQSESSDGTNVIYPGNGGDDLPIDEMTLGLSPKASGLKVLNGGCNKD